MGSGLCTQCGQTFKGNANQKRCNACRFPMTIAQWAAIPRYEGCYDISQTGDIRSLLRTPVYYLHPTPRPKRGYAVTLVDPRGQKSKIMVQRLLLLTFHPIDQPDHYFAIPRNGDYFDTHVQNWQWAPRCYDHHRGSAS